MARKDYVKSSPKPRKTAAKAKPKSRPFPLKLALIAIIVVGGFGYGLFFLNQQPEVLAPAPATPVVTSKPTQPAKSLPKPPTEKWEYVEILPNREIEVTAKELQVSDIPYIMQCGAYKTLQQADTRKANIAFQGLSSKIRKKEGSSWYRVVLGPYKFKREAERDKHKLQRAKIEPCAIWKESQ